MELQLFLYKNIALHFYYSKDSFSNNKVNVKNIFIYFPGLPQLIDEDFFEDKVNKNTAFFRVCYLGSWLSGGSFTYKNCKETVELATEFIRNKKGVKTFDNKQLKWVYQNLHILGYSFAGNPILSAKISQKYIKNVILFAPLIFLHKKEVSAYLKDEKTIKSFYDFSLFFLEFLRRGYKFSFRGIEKQSWEKYFSGRENKSLIKIDKNYPKITIFHGKLDEKINYTSSLFFKKEKWPNTKVFLVDKVGHDFKKLFDINKINKVILS